MKCIVIHVHLFVIQLLAKMEKATDVHAHELWSPKITFCFLSKKVYSFDALTNLLNQNAISIIWELCANILYRANP